MAMLAGMAAWKQVFRIHTGNPDRTPWRPISIKILHCVAEKKRTSCLIKSHPDGDLKNIALRAGWKGWKGLGHADGWDENKNINTKPCRLRLCRVLKLVLLPYVNKFPTDGTPPSNALRASRHLGKSQTLWVWEKPLRLGKSHPDGDLRTSRCALDEKDFFIFIREHATVFFIWLFFNIKVWAPCKRKHLDFCHSDEMGRSRSRWAGLTNSDDIGKGCWWESAALAVL